MLSGILSLLGAGVLVYIFLKVRKLNKERALNKKELEMIYTIGFKEYNKSLINQIKEDKIKINSCLN